jgi:hypothetical protein
MIVRGTKCVPKYWELWWGWKCKHVLPSRGDSTRLQGDTLPGVGGSVDQNLPPSFGFWLEWDRGSMNARDVAVKFDAYRHFVSSGEWSPERRMHRVA